MSHLLILNYINREGKIYNRSFLRMPDYDTGVAFAHRLAKEWFGGMPNELPFNGEFATPRVSGDAEAVSGHFAIEWTNLTSPGLGEKYVITVQPLSEWTETKRLDFWNDELKTRNSL